MIELSTVEMLYLLSTRGEEDFEDETALAAILSSLYAKELVTAKKESLILTSKGKTALQVGAGLEEYELDVLRSIRDEDEEEIVDAVEGFSFKKDLVEKGFLAKEKHSFLGIITWNKIIESEKTNEAIREMVKMREQIKAKMEKMEPLKKEELDLIHAFPSICQGSTFKKYVESAVDVSASNAMMIAAMNTVIINTIILTTAFNMVASSAASCSCTSASCGC